MKGGIQYRVCYLTNQILTFSFFKWNKYHPKQSGLTFESLITLETYYTNNLRKPKNTDKNWIQDCTKRIQDYDVSCVVVSVGFRVEI